MRRTDLYIGLISGTSIDGIDAVLADFSDGRFRLLASHSQPIPESLRQDIVRLCQPGGDDLDLMGYTDIALGDLFAEAVASLLAKAAVNGTDVTAIGSHGQTVRHRPPARGKPGFTLQIADPNRIANTTGITTVADFRRRDMACGGQGAPLVPAFHAAAFSDPERDRAIVNIGGIANVTWLPAGGRPLGFDTGPGNGLMDTWCNRHLDTPYDRNGNWAASGNTDPQLLSDLKRHPFLSLPPPKSTGREDFNREWLLTRLANFPGCPPEDIQATLAQFTAETIAEAIESLSTGECEIFVCGGGAFNRNLMSRIESLLDTHKVATTAALGVDPEWVEAIAFAWLARQSLRGEPGNLCEVTGADKPTLLGGVYHAGNPQAKTHQK